MNFIKDWNIGDEIKNQCLILNNANIMTARDGRPYLDGILQDKSGTIPLRMWGYSGAVDSADNGKIVVASGNVSEYRNNKQIVLTLIRRALPLDNPDIEALTPTAPEDNAEALILDALGSIKDAKLSELCNTVLDEHREQFFEHPAAKRVHHAFIGGLAMHTAKMLAIGKSIVDQYPIVNQDLFLTGVFLHDIGKLWEFNLSEVGTVSEYSLEGNLLGHLVIGAEYVKNLCLDLGVDAETTLLLQHMLVSHHGEPEYGAARRPMTPEAILLSLVDMLDSRMEQVTEILYDVDPGAMSEPCPTLDRRKLYMPVLTWAQ